MVNGGPLLLPGFMSLVDVVAVRREGAAAGLWAAGLRSFKSLARRWPPGSLQSMMCVS